MRTIRDMVNQEVLVCVSGLVHTLAQGSGSYTAKAGELQSLTEKAFELSCPIPDYEEAAIQAGWSINGGGVTYQGMYNATKGDGRFDPCTDWCQTREEAAQAACEEDGIDPYDREVYEHWAVTQWLADKLEAKGEKVDMDFEGLFVWARTTTGQAIEGDSVIVAIYHDTHNLS